MRLLALCLLASLTVSLTACQGQPLGKASHRGLASGGTLNQITEEEFESFPMIGNIRSIKFVLFPDQRGNFNRLVMMDPRVHSFHYEYLRTLPEFLNKNYREIEAVTYKKANRKAVLGILSHDTMNMSEGHWYHLTTFSLSMEESPDPAFAAEVKKQLHTWISRSQTVLPKGDRISFMPMPHQHEAAFGRSQEFAKLKLRLKAMNEPENRRAYSNGWGVGKITLVANQEELDQALRAGQVGVDSILVTAGDLRELPPVAGVVSAVPLTEASHLTLLAQMYGMPLLAMKDASKELAPFAGRWAFVKTDLAAPYSPTVFPRLSEQETQFLRQSKVRPKLQLGYDLGPTEIRSVKELRPEQVGAYGGKAVQFGLLQRTIPGNSREMAVGIPISRYQEFLAKAKVGERSLGEALKAELANLSANPAYPEVLETSDRIRKLFKEAQAPAGYFEAIRTELKRFFPAEQQRLKIRSSSNVEDGAEFNGAGLYDSEGVCLSGCTKDDFAKGLVKVWGSLFTARGLWARRQFSVDESKAGMALLAHPPFKGELFNGVVKFSKSGHENFRAEIVTVAGEEDSVTNATEGKAEVVVTTFDSEGPRINDLREARGQPKNRTLMRNQNYFDLAKLAKQVLEAWPGEKAELEAEWKLMPEGGEKIYLKQVRRVPAPPRTRFPDQSVFYFLTGGKLQLKALWSDQVRHMFQRIESLELELASFTDRELAANRVRAGKATLIVNGKAYPGEGGLVKIQDSSENYVSIEIPIKNSLHPNLVLRATLPKKGRVAVETAADPDSNINLEYGARTRAMDISLKDSNSWTDNKRATIHLKQDGCPISVKGESSSRWGQADDEFRTFDRLEIRGLLPRPLLAKGKDQVLYHYQMHSQGSELAVRLDELQGLTDAERVTLARKFGRFLVWHSIELGIGSPRFYGDETFTKPMPAPKGCEPPFGEEEE